MPRLWKSDVKWSPNWSPNPEKMRKNDVNKSMQKRTRPPGYARRVGGYGGRPLLRLNHLFSSRFRLVFVSSSPQPRPVTSCDVFLRQSMSSIPLFVPVLDAFYHVLFGPVFVFEVVIKCPTRPDKRLNARSLKRPMLHTSSVDVPSPDVNLNGSAIPADPQNMKTYKNINEVKLAINHKK